MNPPVQDLPPDTAERVGDVLEWGGKLAVSLAAIWAFIAKIGKPYFAWRQRMRQQMIRSALTEELDCIKRMTTKQEETDHKIDLVLERQTVTFEDMELFLDIAHGIKERQDEVSDLLDEVGLASRDRREGREGRDEDRRSRVSTALDALQDRRKARRRRDDEVRELERGREE